MNAVEQRMRKTYFGSSIPFIPLENYELDYKIIAIIPEEMIRIYKVIAIDAFHCDEGKLKVLTIGMVNPEDYAVRQILENKLGVEILVVAVGEEAWVRAIDGAYLSNKGE